MARRRTAGKQRKASGARSGKGQRTDAIALLKADHRQVEGWFAEFGKTSSDERKADLAERICEALKVHMTIEEEILYPAFLAATGEESLHHEAEIEHDAAKKLIAEIESNGPDDDHFDARVSVLAEMIKHHVNEEEQRGGLFAKARKSRMDLKGLGRRLAERKAGLEGAAMPREQLRGGAGELSAAERADQRGIRRGQAAQQG